MKYATLLIIGPVEEPVSVEETKAALRLDAAYTADDALITHKIIAAREWIEDETNRKLLTQTHDLFLPDFPAGDDLRLPFGKLQTIGAFEWTDSAGVTHSWTVSTGNLVDGATVKAHIDTSRDPGRIVLAYGQSWPSVAALKSLYPLRVRFVCGWATAAALPQQIKEAILVLVKDWYDNPQSGPLSEYTNRAASALVAGYRLDVFGYSPWVQ